MRKLPQTVGPLVPELPVCPSFSVLGIAFPLAGLVRILLQIKDGFCCCGKKSGLREREVGAEQLALSVLKHVGVDMHAQGVCVVSLDDERKVEGFDGMESCGAHSR